MKLFTMIRIQRVQTDERSRPLLHTLIITRQMNQRERTRGGASRGQMDVTRRHTMQATGSRTAHVTGDRTMQVTGNRTVQVTVQVTM